MRQKKRKKNEKKKGGEWGKEKYWNYSNITLY